MKTPKQKRLSKPEKSKCLKNVISLFPLPYPPLPLWPHLQVRVLISFSTPPTQSLIVLENVSTAPGCSGGWGGDAVCYLSWQVHSASSKSSFTGHQCHEALCPEHSLVTNNPPSHPPSLCASHYSLFSLSGDTSRPFASLALQETRTNGRLFPALHVVALITHGFCLLFSFL